MNRIYLYALLCMALFAFGATDYQPFNFSRSADAVEARWVDSMYYALSDTERIGQLLMIRAHSDKDEAYYKEVENTILQHKVGGLCFFQGTPEKQAELTNRYQADSQRLPLLISMDAEWGLGMRLKETAVSYPKQLMLGAIKDNHLIYEMGREIARQCKRLGVHINFAPDVDVNNNAANPVINDRSFGEDRFNVAAKGFQYMAGLQDGGVLACSKHFPGHGDTQTDSHFDLPLISHSAARLDSLELYPFRVLAQYGISSVMIGHLNVPALDDRPKRPTTLSYPVITELLRNKMNFDGLIFTDAMEMQAVAKYFPPGEADLEALRAGVDVVLLPGNAGATVEAVKKALADNTYDRKQFEASVKRVLRAKYRLGLTRRPPDVEVANVRRDITSPQAQMVKRRLIENALTLVRDRAGLAGFRDMEKYRFATLALGDTNRTVFQQYCGNFAPVTHFNVGKTVDSLQYATLLDSLRHYDVVLTSFHNTRSKAVDSFGISYSQLRLVRELNKKTTVALTMFGNPYSLRHFDDIPLLLEAYNEDPFTQEIAAQALFGASDIKGVLPVTVSAAARYGQGITKIYPEHRLGYDLPEAVGLNSDTLRLIDNIVEEMISSGAAPGCQILVAKDNRIVWQKAYGFHTYEPTTPVKLDNLYDLASVTKTSATTISLMQLVDRGKIRLDAPLGSYLPELRNTNKKDLTLEQLLIHQAGLVAWIPFYKKTLQADGLPDQHIYHREADADSDIPVAKDMYMENAWLDTIWNTIFASDINPAQGYKYSDLGLFLSARTLQAVSGITLDAYADRAFYRPLGLATTTYNPWKRGWASRCVPTEDDNYFRHQRLQGYVHDMGAAMLGGVSGHAGLFSNANDLAKIYQMLLNGGSYFGKSYIQPETVRLFTTRHQQSTRRGLGFDMKELKAGETQNMSPLAGNNTFGHTGFTGICVWADPDQQLIYIFMSNRTYPTMDNNKLSTGDFRPRIQSVIYRALMSGR